MDAPYFRCSYFWSLKTTKIVARKNAQKKIHYSTRNLSANNPQKKIANF